MLANLYNQHQDPYHVPLRTLPLDDSDKLAPTAHHIAIASYNNCRNSPLGSSFLSSTSSSSDLADLQGDLLLDLWVSPHNLKLEHEQSPHYHGQSVLHHQQHQQQQQIQFVPAYAGDQPLASPLSTSDHDLMAADLGDRFAKPQPQYSYPAAYLPTFDDQADELFNFEQQQHQQQQLPSAHHHHHHHHHHHQTHAIKPAARQRQRNSSASSSVSGDEAAFPSKSQPAVVHTQSVNTQLYKTELCASFMKMGICPYGNKCQFAHGQNELKTVERPPKWRSKPCANWAKFGSCRYGNRCCFKHGN